MSYEIKDTRRKEERKEGKKENELDHIWTFHSKIQGTMYNV